MSASKNFKDWFDAPAARRLGTQVAPAAKNFDLERFVARATAGLGELEMMARVRQFAAALRVELPDSTPAAFDVLRRSFLPILPDCDGVTDGALQWPIGEFVAQYGVEPDGALHLDSGMELMIELTQRFSSEFAVRPFIEHAQSEVFARLGALVGHPSAHVRRWCSEGTRPRLPWGARLGALVDDPSPILPILEALKDDPEEYVRRSVANNLNDIAKDHEDLVVDIARGWLKGAPELRRRVVSHGLRSLVKAGHAGALDALGYRPPRGLRASLDVAPKSIAIGESVTLTLDLHARESADLLIDFRVHYVKANTSTSPKVFKWTKRRLRAAESVALSKDLALVPRSTRRLHAGQHIVEAQVNGAVVAKATFELR